MFDTWKSMRVRRDTSNTEALQEKTAKTAADVILQVPTHNQDSALLTSIFQTLSGLLSVLQVIENA
jgi:hypothetical protein